MLTQEILQNYFYVTIYDEIQTFQIDLMTFGAISTNLQNNVLHSGKRMTQLLKVNGAICRTLTVDGSQIVIGKNDTKLFNVHGSDLQLIASLISPGTIQWNHLRDHAIFVHQNRWIVIFFLDHVLDQLDGDIFRSGFKELNIQII